MASPDFSASSDRVRSARERAAFNELCITPAFYVGVAVKRFFGILANYASRNEPVQPPPVSESINSAGSTQSLRQLSPCTWPGRPFIRFQISYGRSGNTRLFSQVFLGERGALPQLP